MLKSRGRKKTGERNPHITLISIRSLGGVQGQGIEPRGITQWIGPLLSSLSRTWTSNKSKQAREARCLGPKACFPCILPRDPLTVTSLTMGFGGRMPEIWAFDYHNVHDGRISQCLGFRSNRLIRLSLPQNYRSDVMYHSHHVGR